MILNKHASSFSDDLRGFPTILHKVFFDFVFCFQYSWTVSHPQASEEGTRADSARSDPSGAGRASRPTAGSAIRDTFPEGRQILFFKYTFRKVLRGYTK